MEREKLMETLKKTNYFSIMIDAPTDAEQLKMSWYMSASWEKKGQ